MRARYRGRTESGPEPFGLRCAAVAPPPLFSAPAWLCLLVTLVVLASVAEGVRLVAGRVMGVGIRERLPVVTGPLTAALATLFTVMAAFTISTEAGYLRAAQVSATAEATMAGRLAWASTTPGVDGAPVRAQLAEYLRATVEREWGGTFEHDPPDPVVAAALGRLERSVRAQAVTQGLPSAVSSEMLGALDALVGARRERIGEASMSTPVGYLVVVAAAGLALVANVALLSTHLGRRGIVLAGGLVVVVAAVLTLLVALAAPFAGSLTVDQGGLTRVLADLGDGFFTS